MRRLLVLSLTQWWVIVSGLIVVMMFFVLMAAPDWYWTYTMEVRGPVLQRCLGFAAAYVDVAGKGREPETMFTITAVNPDSPLAGAGIRSGDVPLGYQHGMAMGFYGDMDALVHGAEVTLSVVSVADRHRGHDTWRVIRLGGQRITCP